MDKHQKLLIDKEISYWNLITLNSLTAISKANKRQAMKEQPTESDFQLRDLYFSGKWTEERKQPNSFLLSGIDQISKSRGTNLAFYDQSKREELFVGRYNFWKRIMKMRPKTKQEADSKRIVQRAVFNARLLPIAVFLLAGTTIMKVSGIMKLHLNAKLFGVITSVCFAYFWTNYRMSTRIFNDLTRLPDETLQRERKQLLSESILLDGSLSRIFELSRSDFELMEQVDKETNRQTQKHMYEMLGCEVVE